MISLLSSISSKYTGRPTASARPVHSRGARAARVSSPGVKVAAADNADAARSAVRKLILMRHADSEESGSGVRDHDRSITAQGKLEAASIARKLCELNWLPDLIVASNSRRTQQTLNEMAEAVSRLGEVDAHFLGSLYTVAALDGQTRTHLEECLTDVVDDARDFCVMCIGHNKGWEEAASSMVKSTVRLQTATAALLQHEGSWSEVLQGEAQWELVDLVSPQP